MASMDREQSLSLADAALKAAGNAIAGHSGFRVGAALMAADGSVYTGCNIENPSLMLTVCAERVALFKALSEGAREFSAIAVVSPGAAPCYPCGSCRQALHEFAPGLVVIVDNGKGKLERLPLAGLLPKAFNPPAR